MGQSAVCTMLLRMERDISLFVVDDVALEGGPFVHKYRAAQFHFHWGKTSQEGAEHLIDGKAYAAEVSSSSIFTCKMLSSMNSHRI